MTVNDRELLALLVKLMRYLLRLPYFLAGSFWGVGRNHVGGWNREAQQPGHRLEADFRCQVGFVRRGSTCLGRFGRQSGKEGLQCSRGAGNGGLQEFQINQSDLDEEGSKCNRL